MAAFDAQRLELARSVWGSLATENELTRDQARAFVRGLQTSWNVGTISWQASESNEQLEDARRLLHTARLLRELEGPASREATECYRRAAEILEWLSRAGDPLKSIAPIDLLAAAAFQLGGLPAMSRGLLLQTTADDPGSLLYGAFLQADFDGVIEEAANFWRANPELTGRTGSHAVLEEEGDDRLEWYFTAELVRSLGLFSHALRRNDSQRLERALAKLTALDEMAVRTFSEDVSILVSLMQEVALSFKEATIFKPLKRLSEANPAREPRLNSYARGQFSRGRGILWRPQMQGLERLLDSSSFALCTPTGSGKTLVAIMALLKELVVPNSDDGLAPLALYLVPSRALAGEVEARLRAELGSDLTITGLYGGTDWGITDYWLQSDSPTVLIATVEKADALMRYVGPHILARLRLLILDEAHQVVAENTERTKQDFADHSNRSVRIESFVSRLLARAPDIARIALTAVAGGASGPVARWIEGSEDATAIGTHYRSTRQVIGAIEFAPGRAGRVTVEMVNGQMLFVRGRDEPVYIRLGMPAMPTLPAAMRNTLNRFNATSVLWTSLHLVGDDRRVLISVAQEPEEMMRWFKEAFELPDWAGVNQFLPPTGAERAKRFADALAACVDYCGTDSYEAALLRQGIATSHGQMPQRLRRLMTDLIDSRVCPITVATATLTEGVNLPFDLIFLTSLKRQTYNKETKKSVVVPLATSEFQNLAGRAGRPGATKGMEGMTLVALPTAPSTTAAGGLQNQRQQVRRLDRDYASLLKSLRDSESVDAEVQSPLALLIDVIRELAVNLAGFNEAGFLEWLERISPEDISDSAGEGSPEDEARLADSIDELDSIIVTAVEEVRSVTNAELTQPQIEQTLKSIWQNSFARVAAHQEAWLERALLLRGTAVTEHVYPDAAERRRLYQYGFSPQVGRRFAKVAPAILEILAEATEYGGQDEQERFEVFARIGELVAKDRGYGFRPRDSVIDTRLMKDWQGVLRWWTNVEDAQAPVPGELRAWQRFVADNIEFRLGVVIGAVVAQAWSNGADTLMEVPSLEKWKETTGLPWFGFWARELLRWGTLEPFVAFAMAQGLAGTRAEAEPLHAEFHDWLTSSQSEVDADDWIDPRKFLAWDKTRSETGVVESAGFEVQARIRPGAELRHSTYSVLPVVGEEHVSWLDAAGFEIARSARDAQPNFMRLYRTANDYELQVDVGARRGTVRRTFRAR